MKLKQSNQEAGKKKLKSGTAGAKNQKPAPVKESLVTASSASVGKVKKAGAKLAVKAGLKKNGKRLLSAAESTVAKATNGDNANNKNKQESANDSAKIAAKKQAKKRPAAAEEEEATRQTPESAFDSSSSSPSAKRKAFMADTSPVLDPILLSEIRACIELRMASTVRLRPLSNRLRLKQIAGLCQSAKAARVPWNYARNRNKGVAFLEFDSPEAAKLQAEKLDGNKSLGARIGASVRDDLESVDARDYNCSRVVVSSLHPLTSAQELKLTAPKVKQVDFLCGSRTLRKHAPAVAFLTFGNERDALDAIREHQGEEIRGRKTSWMFQKKAEKLEEKVDRAELVVFGVSKRVSDEDLLKAFPNCLKVEVRSQTGMAIIRYGSESDCQADYGVACKSGGLATVGKSKLRVFFGHSNYKPVELRRKEAAERRRLEANLDGREAEAKSATVEKATQQKQQQQKKKNSKFDPDLLNKSQLIVKDFNPSIPDGSFAEFVDGVRRVFFTANRRLAFLHFGTEAEAMAAKEKLATELFHGQKLKVSFAMDKPDKKAGKKADKTVDKKFDKRGKAADNAAVKKQAAGKVGVKKSRKPPPGPSS